MKRILIVDLDTERDGSQIKIGLTNKNLDPNPVSDMFVLCEAIVTLIHLCHQHNIKKDTESIRDCIKHISSGFAEAGYLTRIVGS
jgi:hypothetical protein